jgi:hypothetical protein
MKSAVGETVPTLGRLDVPVDNVGIIMRTRLDQFASMTSNAAGVGRRARFARGGTMVSSLAMVGIAPEVGCAPSVPLLATGLASTAPAAVVLAPRRANPA